MSFANHIHAGFEAPKVLVPAPRPAPPQVRLFGLDILSATSGAAIDRLLAPGRRSRVAFVNAHCCNVAARDADYADALATADMLLPDGIGVEIAARMTGQRIAENLNGTDFTPALLREAARRGMSVFLLGARPGVAALAADRLNRDIPGLRVVGSRDGYEGMADEAAVIAAVNRVRPDILLVALGVPFQDTWLAQNAHRFDTRIVMGVGALFDFLSGRMRRAPAAVRAVRLEWAWRLAMEPRRMARRYLIGNLSFMARAARDALARADAITVGRRAMDIAASAAALTLFAPLGLAVAAAIKCDSAGPVLFRQTRIGKDGQPFTMYKFRSMAMDADGRRAALQAASDRPGICFKARRDPRVTRIGRILRRYSIDELPQLLNVLRGEMALVGPRPALPAEVEAYPAKARGRLALRPGLTGIWQVSGRADIGFDRMIDMDLAYVRSRSMLLDMVLIAATFRAVLGGRGAY